MKEQTTYRSTAATLRERVRLHAARRHRFRLRPGVLTLLEIDDVLFSTDSAVVMPCPLDDEGRPEIVGDEDTPLSAQGLGLFFVVLQFAKEHKDVKLLAAGHTDTTGAPAHNLELSEARAATVYALLRGARDLWAETCDAWHQTADVQRLLKYHAFRNDFELLDPGPIDDQWGPKTRSALEYLQVMYNEQRRLIGVADRPELAVDGVMGPKTWGAFFDFYQFDLAQMLGGAPIRTVRYILGVPTSAPEHPSSGSERPSAGLQRLRLDRWRKNLQVVDPNRPYVGFGESFPIEASYQDAYRSETNRRVAFLFFDPADVPSLPPEQPARGGTYTADECSFYDSSSYQRRLLEPGEYFAHQVEFQTVDELGYPVPDADVVIRPLTGGKIEAQSDGEGYCKVEEVPPGLLRLMLPDETPALMHLGGRLVKAVLSAQHPDDEEVPIASVIVEFPLSEKERERHWKTKRSFGRSSPPPSRPVPAPDERARPNVAPPAPAAGEGGSPQSEAAPSFDVTPGAEEAGELPRKRIYAHDNLALVAGQRAGGLDREMLREVVAEWIDDHHPQIAKDGFAFMVLDSKALYGFGEDGKEPLFKAGLKKGIGKRLRGAAGAYAAFASSGDPLFRDMKHKASIITLEGRENDEFFPVKALIPTDAHERFKNYVDEFEGLVKVLYHTPADTAELQSLALQGGAGVLESYGGNAGSDGTHQRNKDAVRYMAGLYRGYLQRYINRVEAIGGSELEELAKIFSKPILTDAQRAEAREKLRSKVKEEVGTLKRLGPPKRIYRFPRPTGSSDQQWNALFDLNDVSDFTAWRAISAKLDDIADQHSEGAVFFRVTVSLNKDIGKGETAAAGGHFAGSNVKVETTIDVGADGLIVKRDLLATGKAKIGPNKKGLSLGVEGEWNMETGERKTTFKGNIKDVGAEVSTDGNVKLTAPHGASAEYNAAEQQFGQGVEIPIPGGSVYLGLHMQGILEESITAYLTGAPGFFERRHPYDFFDPALRWDALSGYEQENLKVFKWTQKKWNSRGETKFENFPDATKDWFSLSDKQKRSAAQLGIDRRDWKKWKLASLPPDEEPPQ